jgi:hypothetical protein
VDRQVQPRGFQTDRGRGLRVVLELEEQERARFRALSLPVREIFTATCGPRAAAALEAVLDAVATAAAQD